MWILLGNLLKKTRSVFISILKHVKIQLLLVPVLTGKTLGCRHSRPLSLGDGVVHNEYNLKEHFNAFFFPLPNAILRGHKSFFLAGPATNSGKPVNLGGFRSNKGHAESMDASLSPGSVVPSHPPSTTPCASWSRLG